MEFFQKEIEYKGHKYLGHHWTNISMFNYFHENDLLNELTLFYMLKHQVKIIYSSELFIPFGKGKKIKEISITKLLTIRKVNGISTNFHLMESYINKLIEIGVIYKSKKGNWHFAGVKTINRLFPFVNKNGKVYNSKLIKISVFDNYELTRKIIHCSKIISAAIKQKKEVERISGIQSIIEKVKNGAFVSKKEYKLYIKDKKLILRNKNTKKTPKRSVPYLTLSRQKIAKLYLYSDVVNLCTADNIKKFLNEMGILEFRRKLQLFQENVTYKYFLDVQSNSSQTLVFKYTINGLGNIYKQLSSEFKFKKDKFVKYKTINPIESVNYDTNFMSVAIIKKIKEKENAECI